MKLLDHISENDFFGPGTDIIVSLTAVLILLFAVNSNLHNQRMRAIKREYDAQVDHLLAAYKEIGQRMKKAADLPDDGRKLNALIDINQDLYERLVNAKKEKEEALVRLEAFLSAYRSVNQSRREGAINSVGNLDLRNVRKNQLRIVTELAEKYHTRPKEKFQDTYVISIDRNNREDIVIRNEVTLQTFTFGNHILFDMDEVELKSKGREILTNIGNILKGKLAAIREIQIQGHADPQRSKKYASNLQLAANRAITVFDFFQSDIGIDPAHHIMSATSFGQYMPIQRSQYDQNYTRIHLSQDNNTVEKRARNRRIEIVLFYYFMLS